MTGFIGRDVLLTWGGVAIPGVREKDLSLNGTSIDVTSGEDNGSRLLLANISGEDSVDIKISGVTKNGALKHDWFNHSNSRALELDYPDGSIIRGTFQLITYTEKGSYKDAVTFDASFQSSGEVTFLPYS